MTTANPRPHSVPALPLDLRLSAIGRRVSASGPLAIVLSDLAFGTRERDDVTTLHLATRARVADAVGVSFRTVTPAVWKRTAGIPAGKGMKDLARARAIERWPGHAELFARACDHDRAEAALIGWAGLHRERMGR